MEGGTKPLTSLRSVGRIPLWAFLKDGDSHTEGTRLSHCSFRGRH